MPKWTTNDNSILDNSTYWCQYAAGPGFAEAIVARHNSEIAALEAERDEYRRRLDGVLKLTSDCGSSLNSYYLVACLCGWKGSSSECEGGMPIANTGDYDDIRCPACGMVDPAELHARAVAIAEGRDNA